MNIRAYLEYVFRYILEWFRSNLNRKLLLFLYKCRKGLILLSCCEKDWLVPKLNRWDGFQTGNCAYMLQPSLNKEHPICIINLLLQKIQRDFPTTCQLQTYYFLSWKLPPGISKPPLRSRLSIRIRTCLTKTS